MKTWLHNKGKYVVAVILALAVMCVVMVLSSNTYGVSSSGSTYANLGSAASSTEATALRPTQLPVTMKSTEHGEDGVIEWTDEGMETCIRAWLNRPEGDVLRSDVWEIRCLRINLSSGILTVLKEPSDGETFTYEEIIQNQDNWIDISSEKVSLESLADLCWFDSLQYLSIQGGSTGERMDLNVAGPENCANLEFFQITRVNPTSLEAVAEMRSLITFSATNCSEIDLAVLSDLESLSIVEISQTDVASLEPLRGMALTELYMREDTSASNSILELDYSPLASLSELETLCLSGINDLVLEDLAALEGLEQLRTLYLAETDIGELEEIQELLPQVETILL